MSDNDSDEPIGRRNAASRARSQSSGSKKKNSLPAKNKSKRKIISSDEENVDDAVVKKTEKHPPEIHRVDQINMDIVEPIKITEPSSLSPILVTSLEPPSFSPLLKGPPSPRHHNESLKWKHKVNLLGEKVVDPMIHICDKCHLPILIYARMIPCKHVFCLECGRAADKLCHKCNEKVSRVEQTTLGKVFMCVHQQSKTKELCKRTYLSQRDLQAHIAHRHVKCKEKEKEKATTVPATRDPRSAHPLPATVPQAALQRLPTSSSVTALPPSKVVPFNPPPPPAPPLPPIPALSGPVPPAGPPPPYLTPPPVYAPQMVPPPSAVYTGGQYPPVPSAVHAPAFVHGPHSQAYGQPPPPTAYAPQPTAYDDFRGGPHAPPTHWQQRPPPPSRDYRAPSQGYYRQ